MPSPPSPPAVSGDAPDALIEALRGLLQARTGRAVQRIETHISWVLLDGEHAWKIKKPVRLGFLDFSALEARRHYCDEELRLNRRLAPALYRDVVAIRGSVSAPRLEGPGEPIEYVLRMRQFAPGALLSERLAAGTLEPSHLDRLAARLATFHEGIPAAGPETPWGTVARIEADTAAALDGLGRFVEPAVLDGLRGRLEGEARRLRPLFERRKAAGRVRECHGDLHLSNAVVLGDEVTAFDCLEFDPGLRWIDVCSDVAFLAMDLEANGRRDLAFRFLDAWLAEGGDYDGVPVLRYYRAYRALVRALVTRIRAAQAGDVGGPDYLALAQRLAHEGDARLLITHGLSGSGKSWLARQLLERAGAIRLRSDVERKRLFALGALERAGALPGQGIYVASATQRTYARLLELAALALGAGYPTIVDASFLAAGEREAFRRLAAARGVPFAILHCRADPALLRERVAARSAAGSDASDADLAVLEAQQAGYALLGEDEQAFVIEVDTGRAPDPGALAARWLATGGPAGGAARRG